MGRILRASALLGFAPAVVWAAEHVTIDNYLRAESDSYMGKCVQKGALGKFVHQREVTKVDPSAESAPKHGQDVIRMSRDTLYSSLILDLASPATLTFPDVGDRFLASSSARRPTTSSNLSTRPASTSSRATAVAVSRRAAP